MASAQQVVYGMTTVFDSKQEDVIAPIPVLGLHGEFRLARKLYARAGVEYFHISVSDQEGSLTDVRASLDWYPWRNWGFGVGYNSIELQYLDVAQPEFDATFTFRGLIGYVTYLY